MASTSELQLPWGEVASGSDEDLPEETGEDPPWVNKNKPNLSECCCKSPLGVRSIPEILSSKSALSLTRSNSQCHISNIERCFNKVIEEEKDGETSWSRLMLADHFYRYRHELLAVATLSALCLNIEGTDKSFREFGILSERTPDYIIKRGDTLYVLEFIATANEDKAAQMKGVESAGFEAKYQKEIKELQLLGNNVMYVVLMYNMNDPENSSAWEGMRDLENHFLIDQVQLLTLKGICRELSRITLLTKAMLSLSSSLLFSPSFAVEQKHDNLKFCYEPVPFKCDFTYKDFNVSVPVYQKINSIWTRLIDLKDRHVDNSSNVMPILDVGENRIRFVNDPRGVRNEYLDKIIADNNKQAFMEILRLRVGSKLNKATDSESGVKFTKKVEAKNSVKPIEFLPLSLNHTAIPISEDPLEFDSSKYEEMLNRQRNEFFSPKYYDPGYESVLLKSMEDLDRRCTAQGELDTFSLIEDCPKTLAHYDNDKVNIDDFISGLKRKLVEVNNMDVSVPVRNQKMKSSFILPLSAVSAKSRCQLGDKNIEFINSLCDNNIGEYTKAILSKTLNENYSFYQRSPPPSSNLNGLYNNRYSLSNKMTSLVKGVMKRGRGAGKSRFSQSDMDTEESLEFANLRKELASISKIIRRIEKEEGILKNIGMVKLSSNIKSPMGHSFRNEMSHFKDKSKQSAYEGVGLKGNVEQMHGQLIMEFDNIMETFVMNGGTNDDFLIDMNTYDEVKLLKDLKQHTLDCYSAIVKQAKDSMLGHSAAFVSRYAHSLTFYSQLPFNCNYVRVDNLGYKDVLLIVRGGSKIFKTKSSKLHRLIFPVNPNVVSQYIDVGIGCSSFKHIIINDSDYIVTPWIMLNENILLDAISFYPRVISFCVLNMDYEKTFRSQIHKVFINVILAFHNRRQTESMLANLRYILLSTMGDYSAFTEIFEEFIGFNYDKLQCYLRLQLIKNYPAYFSIMRKVQKMKNAGPLEIERADFNNIFTAYPIYNTDDLALMIYSTFLMTKAPYQRSVERAANLRGIIKIHELFDATVGLSLCPEDQMRKISVINDGDYVTYSKRLMCNDFALDPYYCTNVGIFADSYFKQHVGKDEILSEWVKILNKNWDSMATTTGLRGMNENNFFGQKGFFVIYDHILNNDKYKEKLMFILDEELSDDQKRKELRSLNQTYGMKINSSPDCLVYHAVDKRQWRGGREIYVMDMETKRMQQPIEKFMAYLCKKTDTELISIPSDKRSQVIHHALFEKDIPDRDFKSWFLTLDCSKWAPKSMFIKFALMIVAMNSIPGSFKTHFLNYLSLLYSKKLYFNEQEVKVLKNNRNEIVDTDFLISDDRVKGFYMIQPYSWVMGIFNYTSSLMHAFNQKYCSYLLRESTMLSFGEDCSLFMFAHSDDSGGRVSVTSKQALERAIFYYEINLKACNHILSKKKCVISKTYFEILSIIYMFSQLLALLPKFLGGIRFLPTDKGPAHDMLQTYSKGIEVMVAGADFNKAYLYQKFYSAEIWRFYYNTTPTRNDYLRPPQYLGMPDAHPLMVLLNGSDSDLIRLLSTGNQSHIITTYRLFKYLEVFDSDEGLIRSLKFLVKIRGVKKGFGDSIDAFKEVIKTWSLSNVNYKNTGMDSLSFLKKLSDPGFTGALVNESETRRMSRAYFFRSGESVGTKIGVKTLKETFQLINEVQLLFMHSEHSIFKKMFGDNAIRDFLEEVDVESPANKPLIIYFRDIYSNSLKLCDYFDRMDFTPEKLKRASRTLKPTHIQIVKFGKGFSSDFDPTQLVSSLYEPNLSWALPNPSNLMTAKQDFYTLIDHLKLKKEDLDPGTALKIVRSHQNKSVKEIYMYSCIPGFIRMIKNFSGIITFLSTNSFQNYEIQGMSLKLRENLTSPPIHAKDIDEDAYYIITLLDVICTIGVNVNLNSLNFNEIPIIQFEGGNVSALVQSLMSRRFTDDNYSYYSHYVEYLNNKYVLWYAENSGCIFDKGAYYTYLKEQKFRGLWYGKGTLAFYFDKSWVVLELHNNRVVSATGSFMGKIDRRFGSFIADTLFNNNIDPGFNDPINKGYESRNNLYLGYDLSGDLSADNHLNIRSGVGYKYQGFNHNFVGDVMSSEVKHLKSNLFLCKTSSGKNLKVYTLKVERAEVIPILKRMIDPLSLSGYLINEGYDDYADFINQEILTSYGAEHYITLQDLNDGFQGSALYTMFTKLQSVDQSLLPSRLVTSSLPAPKGSILRMILNYQDSEGLSIINQPKDLNPSIMSVRNEFPESFSAILSEKMNENFDKIYDDSEQLQMMSEFVKAASNDDADKVRSSCIKLMCYWGYSGLVNVLQMYTFKRDVKNYQIFSINNTSGANKHIFNSLFLKLTEALKKVTYKVYNPRINYDWPLTNLKIDKIEDLWTQYMVDTAYSSYDFKMYNHHVSLSLIKMNNLIIALFKEPAFIKGLFEELKDDYPLNTLDLSPKNANEFVSTLNTLRGTWMRSKGEGQIVKFKYMESYQHLPHDVTQPKSLLNELNMKSLKPGRLKYHYFMNDALRHELSRDHVYINLDKQRCMVKQTIIRDLPEDEDSLVSTNQAHVWENVLTEEYMGTDQFSDIQYEQDSMEPDLELIESSLQEEIDCEIYMPTTVRKVSGTLIIPVKWIILPYVETDLNIVKMLNNLGEHVVLLSNCIINKFTELRASKVYIVNYSTYDGELPDMVAHVMSTKNVPNAFWDKYIGGRRINDPNFLKITTYSNLIRWSDELKDSLDLGVRVTCSGPEIQSVVDVDWEGPEEELAPWLKAGLTVDEAKVCHARKKEKDEINEDIQKSIKEYVENGLIDLPTAERMSAKYDKALKSKLNVGGSSILQSFFTETELIMINKGVTAGDISSEITATEHIKMMQAPESFGTAYLHSRPDNKAFKDMKIKAELDAIHDGLSSLVASANLTMSNEMLSYVKSHYNIWRISVSGTRHKVENKKFFLNLFLSLVNTSSKHRTSKHDKLWQNLINRFALIIGEEPKNDDVNLSYYLPPSGGLRLKYKTIGFN